MLSYANVFCLDRGSEAGLVGTAYLAQMAADRAELAAKPNDVGDV